MNTELGAHTGRELEQDEWAAFFDELNKRMEHGEELEATIEIVSDPAVGTEAERLPLASITYEDGDDQIAIGVGGRGHRFPTVLWHFVDHPRKVVVTEPDVDVTGLIIESEDETLTVVRLFSR
ncbi:MAG: hypothetical protein QOE69_877 [Thermoleophilaceae bacterium]|jgi:hypothetical protein|nr:hypothetical protein [Thermoleophilaceae bacterium]MEA2406758.1 hypothetical protein [Thermoleophilaceae bacterium]